jgi:LysM repeat protein
MPITQETVLVKHVVQAGETLLSIAIDYDVSVEEIQRANNLSSELIRVGDELSIPVVRDVGGAIEGAPPSNFEYIVLQGDTLISIALKFGSTVEDIQVANNLAANAIIRPGDRLLVPVSGAPPEALAVTPEPAPGPAEPGAGAGAATTAAANYAEPRLISPPSGVAIPRTDSVPLQWISVDVLKPNEWYVVQILPRSPNARVLPTVWTRETSFRLGAEYAPAEGQLADYDWLISVVRVKAGSEGASALEAASPPSEIRRFTWK